MWDLCVFLQSGLELLEGLRWYQQRMDPHTSDISSVHHHPFASNSAMSELTNTEKTYILNETLMPGL